MDTLVEYKNVSKSYASSRSSIVALENISIQIGHNEFFVIIGPSGSGKSTLLKMTAGLMNPTGGEILVKGRNPREARKDIGIVFQRPILLRWLSILDNVLLPTDILGLDRDNSRSRAHELLGLVGLRGFENNYPFELSGGMQQRVALCRALIHDPSLLLMDEPFGALDALTRDEMDHELLRLWGGSKTVIFVTHSIPEAVFLADRVAVFTTRPGRLASVVDIDLERPRRQEVRYSEKFGKYAENLLRTISGGKSQLNT